MAFVCRLKQSKLKPLSDQLRRCYSQIHAPCSPNFTISRVHDLPNRDIFRSQFQYFNGVRFYAAPVQVKTKQEEKDTGPRLNEQITASFIRLVMDEEHKVVSRHEALELAKRQNLDLVEVQRTAKPPVCKLMDYHKERYNQQIKEKDRAKKKPEVTLRSESKEVRFSVKTEQKDLQMKANMAKRMMERGYRVKCLAMGTEEQDLDGLLYRLAALIEDVAIVERGPEKEKKGAHIIVRHVKFGLSKKGSGKKVSNLAKLKSADNVEKAEEVPISPSSEIPDEDLDKGSAWSVCNGSDDETDEAFDFDNEEDDDDVSSDTKIYADEEIKITPLQNTSSRVIADSVQKSMDTISRPGARNPERLSPSLPNRRMPPPGLNIPLSTMGPEQVEADVSLFKSLKPPVNNIPKQPQSPASSSPRFGIFSSPKASDAPGEHGVPAGNPNSAINRSPSGQRQGINKGGGQGSWGVFSRENTVSASRTSESQADSQR